MKKIVTGILGFCVVFIAVAFTLPFLIDINNYKPEILAKAKETLGRDLTIEGKISLRLLPLPALSVDKIQLANASEGSQAHMASIDKLQLQIALFPLFRKKVEIDKIELVGADIFLERLGGGRGNWEFYSLKEREKSLSPIPSVPTPSSQASPAFDVRVKSFKITKGRLKYKEGETLYEIHNISSNIDLTSLQGPLQAKGQFDYTDQTVHFEVDLGTFKDVQPLTATFNLGKSHIKTEGMLNTLNKTYKGIWEGRGPWETLAQLTGFNFAVPPFLGKDLDARTEVTASLKNILLSNLSLKSGDLAAKGHLSVYLEEEIKAQGELNGLPGALGFSFALHQKKEDLSGSLKADMQDLKGFLDHIHYDLAGVPESLLHASSFSTHFKITPSHINFSNVNLNFKPAHVKGEVNWVRQAVKPSFFVDLKTDNLNPFLVLLGIKIAAHKETTGAVKAKVEGDQKDLTFDTQATIESTFIALQGTAKNLAHQASFDTNFDVKSTSFVDLLKRFNMTLPPLFNHIAVTGKVGGNLAKIQIDTRTTLRDFTLHTKGILSHMLQKPSFDLHISASHPDVKRLLGALGTSSHAPSGLFTLEGRLGGNLALFKLADIKGTLGAAGAFSGSVDYSRPQDKPYIHASLHLTSVNLDHLLAFLKDSATVPVFPPIMLAAAAPQVHSPWSRDILDLKFLNYFDADLKLDSEKIFKKEMIFDHPVFTAQIKNGILKIMNAAASLYGGSFTLKGQTDSQNNNASHYTFSLKGTELKNLSSKESSVKITQGKLDINGSLITSGDSIYNLVSALRGKITLNAQDGIISGFDLQAITENLMKQNRLEGIVSLVSTSFTKGQTPFSSLEGFIDVQQGVGQIKNLKLLAKGGEGTACGTINLPDYIMNVDTQFFLTDLKNIPPVGVKFTGPLDVPVRTIDSAALQEYMAKNVLNIATDIIGSLRSGKKKPADIIGAIIGGGGNDEQKSPSKQTPGSAPQQPDTGDIIKKPEEAIKGLLKGLF